MSCGSCAASRKAPTHVRCAIRGGVPLAVNSTVVLLVIWALNARITDACDSLRAERRRLEEIFDARLKHLEEEWPTAETGRQPFVLAVQSAIRG